MLDRHKGWLLWVLVVISVFALMMEVAPAEAEKRSPQAPTLISRIEYRPDPPPARLWIQADPPPTYVLSEAEDARTIILRFQNSRLANEISDLLATEGPLRLLLAYAEPEGNVRLEAYLETSVAARVEDTGDGLIVSLDSAPLEKAPVGTNTDLEKPPRQTRSPAGGERPRRGEPRAGPVSGVVPDEKTSILLTQGGSSGEAYVGEYILGPGDIVSISVYDEPDLTKDVRVAADGSISFPLLGKVYAGGLTPTQLAERLEALLGSDYLVNPQVNILVKEYKSQRVSVLGQVQEPGSYHLEGTATVLEVISRAGGIGPRAGPNLVVLRRVPPSEENREEQVETLHINLQKLLEEGDISLNIVVQNNDTLFIPEADEIYVLGEVKNPGPYPIEEGKTTALEAISQAGGFTPLAAPNRTKIVRLEDGVEKTIQVNLKDVTAGERSKDIVLLPADVIVVPESFF